ncbi:hypothetical protein PRUPE_4G245400 [Prunus persica]|uniref:Extensin domain-containing protein n=2 Tax=Prunus persica TaxID=3760 RepID=A0A251PQK6_PRUPE|nr:hypothetical protein PRUPE_4G245400 [Prunus persica]
MSDIRCTKLVQKLNICIATSRYLTEFPFFRYVLGVRKELKGTKDASLEHSTQNQLEHNKQINRQLCNIFTKKYNFWQSELNCQKTMKSSEQPRHQPLMFYAVALCLLATSVLANNPYTYSSPPPPKQAQHYYNYPPPKHSVHPPYRYKSPPPPKYVKSPPYHYKSPPPPHYHHKSPPPYHYKSPPPPSPSPPPPYVYKSPHLRHVTSLIRL